MVDKRIFKVDKPHKKLFYTLLRSLSYHCVPTQLPKEKEHRKYSLLITHQLQPHPCRKKVPHHIAW